MSQERLEDIAERYFHIKLEMDAMKAELKKLRTSLETYVSQNVTVATGGYVVSHTVYGVDRLDVAGLREDHPHLAEEYTINGTATRLTVNRAR
jgi:hypothetical protein